MSSVGQISLIYTAAQQAEDGLTGAFQIEVKQIGIHGSSHPARLQFSY